MLEKSNSALPKSDFTQSLIEIFEQLAKAGVESPLSDQSQNKPPFSIPGQAPSLCGGCAGCDGLDEEDKKTKFELLLELMFLEALLGRQSYELGRSKNRPLSEQLANPESGVFVITFPDPVPPEEIGSGVRKGASPKVAGDQASAFMSSLTGVRPLSDSMAASAGKNPLKGNESEKVDLATLAIEVKSLLQLVNQNSGALMSTYSTVAGNTLTRQVSALEAMITDLGIITKKYVVAKGVK